MRAPERARVACHHALWRNTGAQHLTLRLSGGPLLVSSVGSAWVGFATGAETHATLNRLCAPGLSTHGRRLQSSMDFRAAAGVAHVTTAVDRTDTWNATCRARPPPDDSRPQAVRFQRSPKMLPADRQAAAPQEAGRRVSQLGSFPCCPPAVLPEGKEAGSQRTWSRRLTGRPARVGRGGRPR